MNSSEPIRKNDKEWFSSQTRCSKRRSWNRNFFLLAGSIIFTVLLRFSVKKKINCNEVTFIQRDLLKEFLFQIWNFAFDTLAQTHRRQCYVRAEHLFVSLRWEMASGRAIKAFQRPNEPRMTSIASVFRRRRKLRWTAFSIPLWADRAKARFSLFTV